jgi:hypothetical protein
MTTTELTATVIETMEEIGEERLVVPPVESIWKTRGDGELPLHAVRVTAVDCNYDLDGENSVLVSLVWDDGMKSQHPLHSFHHFFERND